MEMDDDDDDDDPLTSPASPDESEIVELGHLVLHNGCTISQLPATILIVSSSNGDQSPVADVVQGNDLERYRQRFVRPPVGWQGAAQDSRTSGSNQITVTRL